MKVQCATILQSLKITVYFAFESRNLVHSQSVCSVFSSWATHNINPISVRTRMESKQASIARDVSAIKLNLAEIVVK